MTPGTDVVERTAEEQALIASASAEFDPADIIVPQLKIAQALTKEVQDEEAKPGDFLNSLTGDNFGAEVQFLVAVYAKGRFQIDRESNKVLDSHLGAGGECSCHGAPYADCPNAEEQYRTRANAGEIEWGKGPPIATTFNAIGFVVDPPSEIPVRLSLMRASAPAGKKLFTLLRWGGGAPWDTVYRLATEQATSGDYRFQTVKIRKDRASSDEERARAVALAQAQQQGAAKHLDDEPEPAPKPRDDTLDA